MSNKLFYKPLTVQQLINAHLLHANTPGRWQAQLFADASDMTFLDATQIDGYDYTNIVLPAFTETFSDFDGYARELNEKGELVIDLPDDVFKGVLTMRRAVFDDMAECTGLPEPRHNLKMFSLLMNVPEAAFSPLPYTAFLYLEECYHFLMGNPQTVISSMASSAHDNHLPDAE